MKYILSSRLYSYSNFVGKYDELDKQFVSNFNSTSDLNCIKVAFCNDTLENLDFNAIVGKEILTLQRFNLKPTKKHKLNIYKFNVTIRNFFCYLYLEFLLYLSFKDKKNTFKNNSEYFCLLSGLKPSTFSFFNHRFFSNLNYVTPKSKSFLTIMFFNNLNLFKQLNYYYIPVGEQ